MPNIITDLEVLRQHSKPATESEISNIVQQLSISIPSNALGLAAPQIGIHKTIFLANLSTGSYAFINPKIVWTSPDKVPSVEGCLSLPDVSRCILRHYQIRVECEKLIDLNNSEIVSVPDIIGLKSLDSFIVQHEYDHLMGKLITDYPETLTKEQRLAEKESNRRKRIAAARMASKNPLQTTEIKPKKISAKKQAQLKRKAKKHKRVERSRRRQEKIRVEIRERYLAEKEGLFKDEKNPSP